MWPYLDVFYQTVKMGSFTKAAEKIHLTQSAVSRKIASLETFFQAKLFHRHPQGLSLTATGKDLYQLTEKNLMILQGLKARIMEKDKIEGSLRVSASPFLLQFLLKDAVMEFTQTHPGIHLEVRSEDSGGDVGMPGEADVAVGLYEAQTSHLVQTFLISLRSGIYASSGYLEKFGVPHSLQDLAHHRLLSYTGFKKEAQDLDWMLKIGLPPGENRVPFYQSNSFAMLLSAAHQRLGLLRGYQNLEATDQEGLIRVLPDIEGPAEDVYVVYPEYLGRTRKVSAFKDYLLEKFERLKKSETGS